ncbi:nuclear transport factor 2 family protein [Massilia sp. METH4]|uniref:YybH family protein n=1 Tax=Massilia sp. METH4 TaxID=3123041 RepID=UPI0030CDD388
MNATAASLALAAALLSGCATVPPVDNATLVRQVTDTEKAFADTMARRDFAAFGRFLDDETVFYTGPAPLRGKAAVAAFWQRYYQGAKAPFSWTPDRVDVLQSGTLAHSSGPVHDPEGKLIGRFNSVWRLSAPGQWKIVFDSGEPVCNDEGANRP